MKHERYQELSRTESMRLTEAEVKAGWHFCHDWDGLLIHKSWPEITGCTCGPYNTEENK